MAPIYLPNEERLAGKIANWWLTGGWERVARAGVEGAILSSGFIAFLAVVIAMVKP